MEKILRLGEIGIKIIANSSDESCILFRLGLMLKSFIVSDESSIDFSPIINVEIKIKTDPPIFKHPSFPNPNQGGFFSGSQSNPDMERLQRSIICTPDWSMYHRRPLQNRKKTVNNDLLSIGDKKSESYTIIVNRVGEYSHFHLFVGILMIVNLWSIRRGGFCIHSSAVVRNKRGHLFLGRSEAGKTTVTLLSDSLDYPVLGDDLNLIFRDNTNEFRIAAIPSASRSPVEHSESTPLLASVFFLKKDPRNYALPISSVRVALGLFESALQVPKIKYLPPEDLHLLFKNCCDLARKISGYNLHFQKSPNFWKVIDKEFPD